MNRKAKKNGGRIVAGEKVNYIEGQESSCLKSHACVCRLMNTHTSLVDEAGDQGVSEGPLACRGDWGDVLLLLNVPGASQTHYPGDDAVLVTGSSKCRQLDRTAPKWGAFDAGAGLCNDMGAMLPRCHLALPWEAGGSPTPLEHTSYRNERVVRDSKTAMNMSLC